MLIFCQIMLKSTKSVSPTQGINVYMYIFKYLLYYSTKISSANY